MTQSAAPQDYTKPQATVVVIHPSVQVPRTALADMQREGMIVVRAEPGQVEVVRAQYVAVTDPICNAALAAIRDNRYDDVRETFAANLCKALLSLPVEGAPDGE